MALAAEYVRAVALQKNLLQSSVKFSRTTVGAAESTFLQRRKPFLLNNKLGPSGETQPTALGWVYGILEKLKSDNK
jgi:hypothetical protein